MVAIQQGLQSRLAAREVRWIDELVTLAATRRICLLCFERNPGECHRSLIAREMEQRSNGLNLKVEHISY
ncbi:MAG: hypothetical protein DME75_12325 [Verrucomicrobia bacterium]|nr:MAG: hypothetical protein DME75_12325 [Verrucomicrobiota bacterium]